MFSWKVSPALDRYKQMMDAELKRNKMRNPLYVIQNMKNAFTLVEVLIMVAILGILAAIVLPRLQEHITEARESAAKDTLRILRSAIEVYAAQHDGTPPGCYNDTVLIADMFYPQLTAYTDVKGKFMMSKSENYPYGPYLRQFPENPFNNNSTATILQDDEDFPETPQGSSGWFYKPTAKQIRLDWPGTDKEGARYYDY